MASTFFGLNISKSGLDGYQASINTTAHNISNATTDGYSRQIVKKQAADAQRTHNSYGMQGSGVDIVSVRRERNSYYDTKYWNNTSYYGQYYSKNDYMGQIENYFNEIDKEGFTTEFNNFYNAMVDLTSEPDSTNKKVTVVSYASSLAEYFNGLSKNLTQVQEDANTQIKSMCDRINSIADQVLSLNKQIKRIEITGEYANDLRDQRDLLVDELSQYVNVQVKETDVHIAGAKDADGKPLKAGITDFSIYINDQLLVDDLTSRHLICTPRENKVNENDLRGLYEINWDGADGMKFDLNSTGMDGQLKGLFDIRDGNNAENFKGTVSATAGDDTIKVSADYVNSIDRVNIPDEGCITIGSNQYEYSDFSMEFDADGKITSYTFQLKAGQTVEKTVDNATAQVGERVLYKGIPYYQAQLNEFVRTFSQSFNALHNTGVDKNAEAGKDFFTAANATTGEDMVVEENAQLAGQTVSAKKESYYRITAANWAVNSEIVKNANLFCTRDAAEQGVASCEMLKKLVDLKENVDMFSQGKPSEFLQAITADISIDSSKAKTFEKSLKDVTNSIANQRLSISGVDSNQELANLVIYKNGYDLCSKMISVFNQIYDKLINQTGL